MKERPILFNGEMVRAILEGRKVQTRRPIKPQPKKISGGWFWDSKKYWFSFTEEEAPMIQDKVDCPYGQPGDRLWVRETFRGDPYTQKVEYKSDSSTSAVQSTLRWRPSIHMPRWASRILLEITNVRVERIKEIDEEGAGNEGRYPCLFCIEGDTSHGHSKESARSEFEKSWKHIYPGSWDRNDWVWVLEFKRI